MIPRVYSSLIQEYLYLYPCVFLSGPRQAGKTSLLSALLADYDHPHFLLDLERDEDADKLRIPEKYFRDKSNCLVVVDEIQRMPSLYAQIKSVLDEPGRGIRFLIAGSGSGPMKALQNWLGPKRSAHLEISPLNCMETAGLTDQLNHWFSGGFIIPLQMQDPELRPVWYASYLRGLAERDLPLTGLKEHPELVRKILPFIAEATGEELNKAEITRQLGIRPEILNHVLQSLTGTGIIRSLESFPGFSAKRVVRSPRYYLADTGLLHYLLGIRSVEQLLVSSYAAASWTNYVINQVAANAFPPVQLRYYQTHDGAGCDLLVLKGKRPICCISAQRGDTQTISRGFTTAIHDMSTRQNIIAIPGKGIDNPLRHNIRCCDVSTMCRRVEEQRMVYARKVYVPRKLREEEGF
ncbi:MAG: AAA family ATPase [Bacteroidales bacterium]